MPKAYLLRHRFALANLHAMATLLAINTFIGVDIPVNEENITKATEYSQVNSKLKTLYRFRNFLQVVTTQYTLDEDGSEHQDSIIELLDLITEWLIEHIVKMDKLIGK